MDGIYLKEGWIYMDSKIIQWLENELPHISLADPVSVHLEELLGRELKGEELVTRAVEVFSALVKELAVRGIRAIPLLAIPLHARSNRLTREVPQDLMALVEDLDMQTPSLYLLHRDAFSHAEFCEEYRYPLPFDLTGLPEAGFYAYYREFRYPDAIENDWEYTRCVYVCAL
jgi:hypothetical protein